MARKPTVNKAYSQFAKDLATKGLQAGEKERIAAVAAKRGVTKSEARKIAVRRTSKGQNIAGSAEAGGELRRGSIITENRIGTTPTGKTEKTVTMRKKGAKADKGVTHRKQLKKEGEKIAARGQRRMNATRRKDEISPATKAKEAKNAADAKRAHDRSVAIAMERRAKSNTSNSAVGQGATGSSGKAYTPTKKPNTSNSAVGQGATGSSGKAYKAPNPNPNYKPPTAADRATKERQTTTTRVMTAIAAGQAARARTTRKTTAF